MIWKKSRQERIVQNTILILYFVYFKIQSSQESEIFTLIHVKIHVK